MRITNIVKIFGTLTKVYLSELMSIRMMRVVANSPH